MGLAATAAQQNSAAATATAAASTGTGTTKDDGKTALGSLSNNFNDFLKLLMTQLKNQDPTSPLDTNQFTTELVQFSQVEQQIKTNSSLTDLIKLTQASEVTQSSAMVGKRVSVQADRLTLQNGKASVAFEGSAGQAVGIAVYSDSGAKLADGAMIAGKGTSTWTWDGRDSRGRQVADGSYRAVVTAAESGGATKSLPFTVSGTATGVRKSGSALQLQLGALAVDFSAVQSVDTK